MERLGSSRAPSATFGRVWVEEEATGDGSSTASSGGRSSGNGSEGAPVGPGRGGEVGELREDEAELKVGFVRAERVWNGGSMVSFELAGVRVDGGGILGFRGGEPEKE